MPVEPLRISHHGEAGGVVAVTGDLRVRLFDHLQAMELGFFTRTKTGVIQSRLQNDVGGVSGVLTNTVTSILGNAVTVVSDVIDASGLSA